MPLNIETGDFSFEDPLADLPPETVSKLKRWALIAFLAVLAVEGLVIFVLLCVLPAQRPKHKPGTPLKTMVVLGSGGHTAEMLKLVAALDKKLYTPRVYVVAETDRMSAMKANDAEVAATSQGQPPNCSFYGIPRSREVGQSYITSVYTTIKSLLVALAVVWQFQPKVLLVNGPGTCIPICVSAYLFRKMFVSHCDIIYVESIARVKSLSLSGKILYKLGIADTFLVQWPELQKLYPKAQFVDRLY